MAPKCALSCPCSRWPAPNPSSVPGWPARSPPVAPWGLATCLPTPLFTLLETLAVPSVVTTEYPAPPLFALARLGLGSILNLVFRV